MSSKITKSPTFSSPPVSRTRSRLTVPGSDAVANLVSPPSNGKRTSISPSEGSRVVKARTTPVSADEVVRKIWITSPSNGGGGSSSAAKSPSPSQERADRLARRILATSPHNGGGGSSSSAELQLPSLFSYGGLSPSQFTSPGASKVKSRMAPPEVKKNYAQKKAEKSEDEEKSAFVKKAKEIETLSFDQPVQLEMCGKPIVLKRGQYLGQGNFSDAYRCEIVGRDEDLVMSTFYSSQYNPLGTKSDHYLFHKMKHYKAMREFYTPHVNFDEFLKSHSVGEVKEHFKDGFILTRYVPYPLPKQLNKEQVDELITMVQAHVKADIPIDFKRDNLRCDDQGHIYLVDAYEMPSAGQDEDDANFRANMKKFAPEDSDLYKQLMKAYAEAAKERPQRA